MCQEPFVTEGYTDEQTEYLAMRKSVIDYGGFYFGRYEAGTDAPRTSSSEVTSLSIKKGKYPYNNVPWGADWTEIGDKGAVYLCHELYKNKNVYGVQSTLCYGVEWDAMLYFIKDTVNVSKPGEWVGEEYSYYGEYSEQVHGSYTELTEGNTETVKPANKTYLLQTGVVEGENIKNIYDLRNCSEWTMERGGGYPVIRFAATRTTFGSSSVPTRKQMNLGFRVTLYVL